MKLTSSSPPYIYEGVGQSLAIELFVLCRVGEMIKETSLSSAAAAAAAGNCRPWIADCNRLYIAPAHVVLESGNLSGRTST